MWPTEVCLPNEWLTLDRFGPLSPVCVYMDQYGSDDGRMPFIVDDVEAWRQLEAFFVCGHTMKLSVALDVIERYLDIPLLRMVLDHPIEWQTEPFADQFLWWWQKQSTAALPTSLTMSELFRHNQLRTLQWLHARQPFDILGIRQPNGDFIPAADWAAENGHLATLQWIRANGGEWTSAAADGAARNGHLETLQWIRANGGEWTHRAADGAAMSGHLETLQWIRANGGEWTSEAADRAAENGHLATLQWIRVNGGEWTHLAADSAALNGHLETLQWIRANGGEWTHCAADLAAANGHLKTLQWIRANGGEWTHHAVDMAVRHGHLETVQWIKANGGDPFLLFAG